jgi:hypothetical protein
MSKGGGGGPQETTSTVTQSNLPEYAEPYFTRLLKRTEAESTTPYTTYGGQRFAEFDPYQEMAFTGAAGMAAAGTPWQMQQASDITSNVAYQDPTAQMTAAEVTSYMSPYQQSVIDVEKREAEEQATAARSRLGMQAAASGGLGGYREAIQQAELDRNAAQLQADIQTRGSQRGFDAARQGWESDRLARAQQMQQRMGAAQQLGGLGLSGQQAEIQRMNELARAGAARHAQQQGIYDLGYQQYQDQLAYPRQQLGFYSQMLRGLPVQPGTQVSSYLPRPSTAQNILGLGLGGLGLWQALGGGGAG